MAKCIPEKTRELWFLPQEIVTGLITDYARDCKVDPGSFVEASVNATVTHDNSEWKTSCVVLGPAGNCQGPVKCFDIEMEKILYRPTMIPVP